MGGGRRCGIRTASRVAPQLVAGIFWPIPSLISSCRLVESCGPPQTCIPGSFRQRGNRRRNQQRSIAEQRYQHHPQAHLRAANATRYPHSHGVRTQSRKHCGRSFPWRHHNIFSRFPSCGPESLFPLTGAPSRQTDIIVASARIPSFPIASALPPVPPVSSRTLSLNPSPFRPHCRAEERLFLWRGPNTPPLATIAHPIIEHIASLASRASLRDTASYGAGLRKFHLFCDIFSVPEHDRLPASFELLHSFALWAVSDPSSNDLALGTLTSISFEPVSVGVARKYLAAVRAWHIVHGWHPPLSEDNHARINWSLRGLDNLLSSRRRPLRPPVTLNMLHALKATLSLTEPFDACIWAMASCAFFGMMRFGEVSVESRAAFKPSKHLTRKDVFLGTDLVGKAYARLDLPSAKTARPGDTQSVFLVAQGPLCPLAALQNLASVVPALPHDPLFSWRDRAGTVRPMVKQRALARINCITTAWGWGTAFGHSFRIGGASFYLAKKVDPEIVRLAGRWRSLAYETYIRAFEQVATQHLGDLAS
ncbi:hypothetical protein DEU56DRAFT_726100 [Suillus clintonianus]|uniref:uncharacterized protein n=1 Tax=Suillus clintonianus TaxID=1904413 RepID=UPI001B85C735|nr:uncharacterized protein DEU56DRAFT_726100 [Suillus clintonianus]KAG2153837.1 hypothetical protein DEU56DRAFT_726100 [Suillus clintonianus]